MTRITSVHVNAEFKNVWLGVVGGVKKNSFERFDNTSCFPPNKTFYNFQLRSVVLFLVRTGGRVEPIQA